MKYSNSKNSKAMKYILNFEKELHKYIVSTASNFDVVKLNQILGVDYFDISENWTEEDVILTFGDISCDSFRILIECMKDGEVAHLSKDGHYVFFDYEQGAIDFILSKNEDDEDFCECVAEEVLSELIDAGYLFDGDNFFYARVDTNSNYSKYLS